MRIWTNCWDGSLMRGRLLGLLLCFSASLYAQRTEKVRAEYTYHAPENITLEAAKRTALDRAKIQAIAERFGTLVSQSNTTFVSNRNGQSEVDLFSLGGSEVRGEWIETIGEPEYDIAYEQNMLVVKVTVDGRIREIRSARIDLIAKILCNGTELKYERSDFRSGDDLYLYFQSPVDGYLAVYLLDDLTQTVYCLLPYKHSDEFVTPIKKDTPYLFFSAGQAAGTGTEVDEYIMTCNQDEERNTVYIVFSPNQFVKANSGNVEESIPRQLGYEDFQRWLAGCRNRDKEMIVNNKSITIKRH